MWGIRYICIMSTIKFFIKGSSSISQIYVRVRDGRNIDLSIKTQLVVDSENWSSKKGEVKQTSSFSETSSFATTASFASSGNGAFSGSFSGSFIGNGSQLTNVTASVLSGFDPNAATFTIELIDALTVDFYAPDDLRINTTSSISGSVTASLSVNNSAYTLTNLIDQGDKITVTAASASVFNLNARYE